MSNRTGALIATPAPPAHTERTLGQALSGARLSTVGVVAGLALAAIGAVGPWVTSPLVSASGTQGDGKIVLALVFVAALGVVSSRRAWLLVAACSAGIAGGGAYDLIHIHERLAGVLLFGSQVDHVGWGVFVVVGGGVVAFVGSLRS